MGQKSQICVVVTAKIDNLEAVRAQAEHLDQAFIFCADAGKLVAPELGLHPDAFIGDFDSSLIPIGQRYDLARDGADLQLTEDQRAHIESMIERKKGDADHGSGMDYHGGSGQAMREPAVFVLPHHKDMTDSEAAVDVAVQLGFTDIVVLGGLGGRLDHTLGNLAILAKYKDSPVNVRVEDGYNCVAMVGPGTHVVPREHYTYLGVIPYGGDAQGVSIDGALYSLHNATLSDSCTLGVSNEITGDEAIISFTAGTLVLVRSHD